MSDESVDKASGLGHDLREMAVMFLLGTRRAPLRETLPELHLVHLELDTRHAVDGIAVNLDRPLCFQLDVLRQSDLVACLKLPLGLSLCIILPHPQSHGQFTAEEKNKRETQPIEASHQALPTLFLGSSFSLTGVSPSRHPIRQLCLEDV